MLRSDLLYKSTTSDSADAEPTEDLTAFSQYTDDMSHFLNELTENGGMSRCEKAVQSSSATSDN